MEIVRLKLANKSFLAKLKRMSDELTNRIAKIPPKPRKEVRECNKEMVMISEIGSLEGMEKIYKTEIHMLNTKLRAQSGCDRVILFEKRLLSQNAKHQELKHKMKELEKLTLENTKRIDAENYIMRPENQMKQVDAH